ncbi:hypothetical protein B0H10DRAFT_1950734 [Mycena sp. CBHHK59/15]|nr:hypothetical protein B0H10DRAFT_1950734 [Mycena sp. CBHHK59/15]
MHRQLESVVSRWCCVTIIAHIYWQRERQLRKLEVQNGEMRTNDGLIGVHASGPLALTLRFVGRAGAHACHDFNLPRPTLVARGTTDRDRFFSKYAADTVDASMILRLRHLDLPAIHARYPFSTLGHLFLERLRKPWTDARDWLKKQMERKKNPDMRRHAADASRLLGILPWKGKKRGLSDSEPIHTLWRCFGVQWLSSTDIDDVLELLRNRISKDPDLVGAVRVEAVEFTAKITAAFNARKTLDYHGEKGMRWLRSRGNDVFGHGERRVTIAHLGVHNKQKHWVALAVDGPNRKFLYGDSLGKDIPPVLRQAYKWWMGRHTGDSIRFGTLPTSTQTDGHSCGMLFSRLENWVLDRIADEEEELGIPTVTVITVYGYDRTVNRNRTVQASGARFTVTGTHRA